MSTEVVVPELVDVNEARRLLGGISRTTLWRMDKAGTVKSLHVGGRTFFSRESIAAYLNGLLK